MMTLWLLWVGFVRPIPGLADTLLHLGDAFHAITEYQRQLFFGVGDSLAVLQGLARAYEARGRWADALRYWGLVNYHQPQPEVRHHMARLLLLQERASEALILLEGDTTREGQRLRAIARGLQGHYGEARDSLAHLGISLPAFPSPGWIRSLSWVLPGAGFLLLGEPVRGLSSMAALVGSLGWAAYLAQEGHYGDAAAVGLSLVLRFYLGGRASLLHLYRDRQQTLFFQLLNPSTP